MIARLAGIGLLVSSASYCAHRMISAEKNKIDLISAYVEIVSHVKNQIDLYSLPIDKIIKGLDPSVIRRIGIDHMPSTFGELIGTDGTSVGEETAKTLREFAFSLGKTYRDMQIKLCDKTISELLAQKKALMDAFPSRKKTIIALTFAICGMTVIALI